MDSPSVLTIPNSPSSPGALPPGGRPAVTLSGSCEAIREAQDLARTAGVLKGLGLWTAELAALLAESERRAEQARALQLAADPGRRARANKSVRLFKAGELRLARLGGGSLAAPGCAYRPTARLAPDWLDGKDHARAGRFTRRPSEAERLAPLPERAVPRAYGQPGHSRGYAAGQDLSQPQNPTGLTPEAYKALLTHALEGSAEREGAAMARLNLLKRLFEVPRPRGRRQLHSRRERGILGPSPELARLRAEAGLAERQGLNTRKLARADKRAQKAARKALFHAERERRALAAHAALLARLGIPSPLPSPALPLP